MGCSQEKIGIFSRNRSEFRRCWYPIGNRFRTHEQQSHTCRGVGGGGMMRTEGEGEGGEGEGGKSQNVSNMPIHSS